MGLNLWSENSTDHRFFDSVVIFLPNKHILLTNFFKLNMILYVTLYEQ